MNRNLTVFVILCISLFAQNLSGQTLGDLVKLQVVKEKELANIKIEMDSLKKVMKNAEAGVVNLKNFLTPYPRWSKGVLGTVGLNYSSFNKWLSKKQSSTSAANVGLTASTFLNMEQKKYFWRNGGNLVLSWVKFNDKDDPDDIPDFQVAADALNFTSLVGFKFNEKLAFSALTEYRTAILEKKLNNPGYLDLGTGITWTPTKNLSLVFGPLNYNFVLSNGEFDYQSSLGTKIVGDYSKNVTKYIAWRSNISAFVSYRSSRALSNWSWVNNFSIAYKVIGVGIDIGLRNNKQEAEAAGLEDNPLQSYYVLGLSYNFSKNAAKN